MNSLQTIVHCFQREKFVDRKRKIVPGWLNDQICKCSAVAGLQKIHEEQPDDAPLSYNPTRDRAERQSYSRFYMSICSEKYQNRVNCKSNLTWCSARNSLMSTTCHEGLSKPAAHKPNAITKQHNVNRWQTFTNKIILKFNNRRLKNRPIRSRETTKTIVLATRDFSPSSLILKKRVYKRSKIASTKSNISEMQNKRICDEIRIFLNYFLYMTWEAVNLQRQHEQNAYEVTIMRAFVDKGEISIESRKPNAVRRLAGSHDNRNRPQNARNTENRSTGKEP